MELLLLLTYQIKDKPDWLFRLLQEGPNALFKSDGSSVFEGTSFGDRLVSADSRTPTTEQTPSRNHPKWFFLLSISI